MFGDAEEGGGEDCGGGGDVVGVVAVAARAYNVDLASSAAILPQFHDGGGRCSPSHPHKSPES